MVFIIAQGPYNTRYAGDLGHLRGIDLISCLTRGGHTAI